MKKRVRSLLDRGREFALFLTENEDEKRTSPETRMNSLLDQQQVKKRANSLLD